MGIFSSSGWGSKTCPGPTGRAASRRHPAQHPGDRAVALVIAGCLIFMIGRCGGSRRVASLYASDRPPTRARCYSTRSRSTSTPSPRAARACAGREIVEALEHHGPTSTAMPKPRMRPRSPRSPPPAAPQPCRRRAGRRGVPLDTQVARARQQQVAQLDLGNGGELDIAAFAADGLDIGPTGVR